jgi:hypothetical protein
MFILASGGTAMPTTKKPVERNGQTTTVRQLKKELSAVRNELEQERRLNRQLARKVLPLLPKKLEDQIPSIDEIKRLADTQPALLEFIDSLK